MDVVIEFMDLLMPVWVAKLPRNLQVTIFSLVAAHIGILVLIIVYVLSGQYAKSGRADFKAKLK